MQRCVFSDALVTVSEGGRELGEFNVTVERVSRGEQSCFLVHAHSHGAIDNTPCGTAIKGERQMLGIGESVFYWFCNLF